MSGPRPKDTMTGQDHVIALLRTALDAERARADRAEAEAARLERVADELFVITENYGPRLADEIASVDRLTDEVERERARADAAEAKLARAQEWFDQEDQDAKHYEKIGTDLEAERARADRLATLLKDLIDIHAHIVMDTPEDRALHERVVSTFRFALDAAGNSQREYLAKSEE